MEFSEREMISLSKKQLEKYNTDGYLIYDSPVLTSDKFISLTNHFEELLDLQIKSGERPVPGLNKLAGPTRTYPQLYEKSKKKRSH